LQKGFTLIELLVVIGVLGILATGLLAAVDPFEQLKKARDANYRNAAIETLNAFTRYYATHGYFPWNSTGTIPTGCERWRLLPNSSQQYRRDGGGGCQVDAGQLHHQQSDCRWRVKDILFFRIADVALDQFGVKDANQGLFRAGG